MCSKLMLFYPLWMDHIQIARKIIFNSIITRSVFISERVLHVAVKNVQIQSMQATRTKKGMS